MSVNAVYLRARHELETHHDRNSSFSQPLLDVNDVVHLPPKKAFHGRIQVKPSKSDTSTEDSTEFEEEIFLYQQFERQHSIEDDPVVILHDN